MKTAIIIPCYNEEKRLKKTEMLEFIKKHKDLVFYLVNDGSKDHTLELLNEIASESSQCHVVDVQPNQGKAFAVFTGFNEALKEDYAYIGFWDADLATPLYIIPEFTKLLDTDKYDSIFGCRVQRLGSNITRKASRHYLGRFFATIISHVLKLHVYDTQCGAKIFRNNQHLKEAFAEPFTVKWMFDVELMARLQKLYNKNQEDYPKRVYEYPLTEWHDVAGSKVTLLDGVKALLNLLKIYIRY